MANNADNHIGLCPNCGNELSVPRHLEKFACMYCGTVLTHPMLRDKAVISDDVAASDELFAETLPKLGKALIENRNIMQEFNRTGYKPSFEVMTSTYRPTYEAFEVCCSADGVDRASRLAAGVEAFLNTVSEYLDTVKNKNNALEDLRSALAIYVVPMIKSFGFSCGDEFCEMLREEWIKKFPKFQFLVGTYEDIASGFRKKFLGLCFITTAVCEFDGKSDDCYELQSFRSFRDCYLASTEEGRALIDEYYEIAPVIVTMIDHCSNRAEVYPMIRDKYLTPCLKDIESGRLESCKARYTDMVRTLRCKYLPQ